MRSIIKLAGLVVFCASVIGCNLGMAPSGGSTAEIESNFKKLDPKQQIAIIKGGPAPAEKKAQLIKAIEDKYGIKDDGSAPVRGGSQSSPQPPTAGSTGQ